MIDRVFSLILLCFSLCYAYLALQFETTFQYEPLGPKAWPLLLAALLVLCAVILFIRPAQHFISYTPKYLLEAFILCGVLLSYATMLETLGFIMTTIFVCLALSLLLRASFLPALFFSLIMGVGGYYLFADIMQLNAPIGYIFQ